MTDFLYSCPNCYVCYIRRKDGEYDTGTEFYRGEMPRAGEIIELVVRSETMKGRVGVVTVPPMDEPSFTMKQVLLTSSIDQGGGNWRRGLIIRKKPPIRWP
jgi:hypothetical protein